MKHLAFGSLLLPLVWPVLFPLTTFGALAPLRAPAAPIADSAPVADPGLPPATAGAPDPAPKTSGPSWTPTSPVGNGEELREETFVLIRPNSAEGPRAALSSGPAGLMRWIRLESETGRCLLERELVYRGAARWIGSETYYGSEEPLLRVKGVWRDVDPRRGRTVVLSQSAKGPGLALSDASHGDVVRSNQPATAGYSLPLGTVEEFRDRPIVVSERQRFLPLEGRFETVRAVSIPLPLPGWPRVACEFDAEGIALGWYLFAGRRLLAMRLGVEGPLALSVAPKSYASSRPSFDPVVGPPVEASSPR